MFTITTEVRQLLNRQAVQEQFHVQSRSHSEQQQTQEHNCLITQGKPKTQT